MKWLLINPRNVNAATDISLGLGYIAAVLEKKGVDVKIIDADAIFSDVTENDIIREISSFKPDVIGVTLFTTFVQRSYQLIKMLKKFNVPLVVGGAHASVCPEETLEHGADICVIKEAETTVSELADYFKGKRKLERIKGIAFKRDGKVIKTGFREYIKNLDSIPLPSRHLFLKEQYSGRYYAEPFGSIITARGCPNACTYCSNLFRGPVRFRSPKNVIKEVKHCIDNYGTRAFCFTDDTFSADPKRVLKICDMLKGLDVKWSCQNRVDCVSREMLDSMREAGCIFIDYGVEHGDNDSLRKMNKNITIQQINRVLEWTKEAGIPYGTNYIFGFPWETENTVRMTLHEAMHVADDDLSSTLLVPYPGTVEYMKHRESLGSWWLNRSVDDEKLTGVIFGKKIDDLAFFTLPKNVRRKIEHAMREISIKSTGSRRIYWFRRILYTIDPRVESFVRFSYLRLKRRGITL